MLFVLVTEWGIDVDRSISRHSCLWECIVHQMLGEDGGVLPSLHGVTSPTAAAGGKNMSEIRIIVQVSFKGSVQFSRSVMFDYLQPHGLQHSRPPCPSPTPRVCSNSCPLSQWCYSTISSSVVPFSSCLQSFPASGSLPMSQFFTSGGQSIRASVSISPSNEYSGLISFRIDWLDLLAVQGSLKSLKSLLQHHSSKASFFCVQPSLWSKSHIHTWLLEKPQLCLNGPLSAR